MESLQTLTLMPQDVKWRKLLKINLAAHAQEDQEIMIGIILTFHKVGRAKMIRLSHLRENSRIERFMELKSRFLIKIRKRVSRNHCFLALKMEE
jgi:hypothetical protein